MSDDDYTWIVSQFRSYRNTTASSSTETHSLPGAQRQFVVKSSNRKRRASESVIQPQPEHLDSVEEIESVVDDNSNGERPHKRQRAEEPALNVSDIPIPDFAPIKTVCSVTIICTVQP